jgi:hypothetical protein
MSINWTALRAWDGSQPSAFEELCCQLASSEPPTPDSRFIRKGAPDAGVECYWVLPDTSEHVWQAKFFLSAPSTKQWDNLTESFTRALAKHPKMTKFVVCLPANREDPRILNQQWFMDKWNTQVVAWDGLAVVEGRKITFEYWGETEIFTRLSLEQHRGRYYFWFHEERFSFDWFSKRLEETVEDAGERYTPALNVELPIAQLFDGLCRTPTFFNKFRTLDGQIRRSGDELTSRINHDDLKALVALLESLLKNVLDALRNIRFSPSASLPLNNVLEAGYALRSGVRELIAKMQNIATEEGKALGKRYGDHDPFNWERHIASQLQSAVNELLALTNGEEAAAANIPVLLISGEAGTGKTHLLCDVSTQRLARLQPSIVLLGQHFIKGDPWQQILQKLGLACTREEFLGALDAVGQACNAKVLFAIDALNEGEGRHLWKGNLASFLRILSRYQWVSVVLSVRTSYLDTVVPELKPGTLLQQEHYGFGEQESEATKRYFAAHGLIRPSIPLISPEFQNPLFLKLFCKGLQSAGLHEAPKGFLGITGVFNLLLDSTNKKLSDAEFLDYNPKLEPKPVHEAMERLATVMAERKVHWLSYSDASAIVDAVLPRQGYHNSLFYHLIKEGLLSEDRFAVQDSISMDGVRFTYERFSDHLIVRHLIDQALIKDSDITVAFQVSEPLGLLVRNPSVGYYHQGWLEALAIQLPEKVGREFPDLIPHAARYQAVQNSFLQSLVWRNPASITDTTKNYINAHIVRSKQKLDAFLSTLLIVASNPAHPYNADFLHRHLISFAMAKRDAWWAAFLHSHAAEHTSVSRLIEWACSQEDKSYVDDDAILLTSTALAWFLCSSNRFLRDHATKGLVAILTSRLHLVGQLLEKFKTVDDLYILERLYSVAHGSALRSQDIEGVKQLGLFVYNQVFATDQPIPHILLRDYARGVVETALHIGGTIDSIDPTLIRPPYHSKWPARFPTAKKIAAYGRGKTTTPQEWSRVAIYDSVIGNGDFERYVIDSQWRKGNWTNQLRSAPPVITGSQRYALFKSSLTAKQSQIMERIQDLRNQRIMHSIYLKKGKRQPSVKTLESRIQQAEQEFTASLKRGQLKEYQGWVLTYEKHNSEEAYAFDVELGKRWVLQRVFNMGWTVELFGDFDRTVDRSGDRTAHKVERIGKKYQWIAWHEFLALAADNLQVQPPDSRYEDEDSEPKSNAYRGPWQLDSRDIDPSCLLQSTSAKTYPLRSRPWWCPTGYDAWSTTWNDRAWVANESDLPSVPEILRVIRPDDGSAWLSLGHTIYWQEPVLPENDEHEVKRRDVWYRINAYIVKRKDANKLYNWALKQNFDGRWMPEASSLRESFLGEYHWSDAYADEHDGYNLDEWQQVSHFQGTPMPVPVILPGFQYSVESGGLDCSIEKSYSINVPAKWLAHDMKLTWQGKEGRYFDARNKLIAFDPSIHETGPDTLLIREDAFLQFLTANDYDIVWTLLGEKRIMSARGEHHGHGYLNISGAFRAVANKIEGKLTSKLKK